MTSSTSSVLAYRLIAEQIPLAGRGTPVCPPTYPSANKEVPCFALSEDVPVFEGRDETRLGEMLVDEQGRTVRGDAVIVDSLAARAHAMNEVLQAELVELLGRRAPGIYVQAPDDAVVTAAVDKAWKAKGKAAEFAAVGVDRERLGVEVARAVADTFADDRVSTWTASHRHADAIIRYAIDPATSKQIWAGGPLSDLIRNLSAGAGDELIAQVPGAALSGFWLSARSPRIHKLARSLTAEITGYGARGFARAAVKGDGLGNIPSDQNKLSISAGEVVTAIGKGAEAEMPSKFGFGQIPGDVADRAVTCDAILLRGTLSVQALRSQLTVSDEYLELVSMMGVIALLGGQAGFRRSGSDFVTGARRLVAVEATGAETDVDAEALLDQARELVCSRGDLLAEAIDVVASPAQVDLIAGRVTKGFLKGGEDS